MNVRKTIARAFGVGALSCVLLASSAGLALAGEGVGLEGRIGSGLSDAAAVALDTARQSLAQSIHAASEGEGWAYEESSAGGVVLTGYVPVVEQENLIVPAEIDGKRVVGLAFSNEPNVRSITFRDADINGDGSQYFYIARGSFTQGKVTEFYFLGDVPQWDVDDAEPEGVFGSGNATEYTFWHRTGSERYDQAWSELVTTLGDYFAEFDTPDTLVEKTFAVPVAVSLDYEYYHLNPEGSVTLIASQQPDPSLSPAHLRTLLTTLEWSSSDEGVASVSQAGQVTAVATGSAAVTVKNPVTGASATCTIEVDENGNFKPAFEGEGTEENPYLIASADDLVLLSSYMQRSDYFQGRRACYRLTQDVDLSQKKDFEPIGSATYPFRGRFDGAGHTITLGIERLNEQLISVAAVKDTALFGYVAGNSAQRAVIENLVLDGSVKATNALYTAALVGRCDYLDISNCRNNASVTGSTYTGGLVGYASAVLDIYNGDTTLIGSTTIERSCNYGSISAYPRHDGNQTNKYVGGIAGYFRGASVTDGSKGVSQLIDCYNAGTVSSSDDCIGGLIGRAAISGKNWTMDDDDVITCAIDENGQSSTTPTAKTGIYIKSCFNYGKVTTTKTAGGYSALTAGALVGSLDPDANSASNLQFIASDCYYLKDTAPGLIASSDFVTDGTGTVENVGARSAADMAAASFVGELASESFMKGSLFPVLVWEVGEGAPIVTVSEKLLWTEVSSPVTLSVAAVLPTGFEEGTLSYQWFEALDESGESAVAIDGAAQSDYVFSSDTVGTRRFFCEVANSFDGKSVKVRSDIVSVDVVSAQPALPAVVGKVEGPDAPVLQMTRVVLEVQASLAAGNDDGNGELSYQWYCSESADGADAQAVDGATGASFAAGNESIGTYYYYCVVTTTYEKHKQATTRTNVVGITVTPLEITSASQLREFAANVNGEATGEGVTYAGLTVVLKNDIDLSDLATNGADAIWTPIGTKASSFQGTFDGQGHTISNLYIESDSGEDYGLFGYAKNATIQNLVLSNVVVKAPEGVGAVVGHTYGSATLRSLGVASGIVVATGNATYPELGGAGGIVGRMGNGSYENAILVENCFNKAQIVCSGNSAGGIAGTAAANMIVRNCYNWGMVDARNKAGGILGMSGYQFVNVVANCYNAGALSISDEISATYAQVGGITGGNAYYYESATSAVSSPSYYLEGTCSSGQGLSNPVAVGDLPSEVSLETMLSSEFAAGLGKAYKQNVAGRYPLLSWESLDVIEGTQLVADDVALEYDQVEYDGSRKTPSVSVVHDGKTLSLDADYRVMYSSNLNAGTAKAIVVGVGDYAGAVSKPFTITPKTLAASMAAPIPDATFGAKSIEPALSVSTENGLSLKENVDYRTEYANNYHAGQASVRVTGVGNFAGEFSLSFNVNPLSVKSSSVRVDPIPSQEHTGQAITPVPAIQVNGVYLTPDVDFTVTYQDNVDAGVATIVVTGTGDLSDMRQVQFLIRDAQGPEVPVISNVSVSDLTLNTGKDAPEVSVANDRGEALVAGVDYKVTFFNRDGDEVTAFSQIGAYSARIEGLGDYAGVQFDRTFNVRAKSIADASVQVEAVPDVEYTGTPAEPTITLFDSQIARKLYKGVDFFVEYEDNVDAGTARAVVYGMGSYTGSLTVSFSIVDSSSKDKVERLAAASASGTAAVIAQKAFPEGSEWVVIARDDNFADAMSATGLAGALGAPIVLTDRNGLSEEAAAAIDALGATKAYVVGGTGAMPYDFVGELVNNRGFSFADRVYGTASWDTSVECAKLIERYGGSTSDVIVAMSSNFQDALSMSAFAYKYKVPIYLESDDSNPSLPVAAIARIAKADGTIYVPGGPGAVPFSSVEDVFEGRDIVRLYGNSGYDTSNAIAHYLVSNGLLSASSVVLASGALATGGSDALAGSALAGLSGCPILLTNPNPSVGDVDSTVLRGADSNGDAAFLSQYASSIRHAYVLGGTYVMPQSFVDEVEAALR